MRRANILLPNSKQCYTNVRTTGKKCEQNTMKHAFCRHWSMDSEQRAMALNRMQTRQCSCSTNKNVQFFFSGRTDLAMLRLNARDHCAIEQQRRRKIYAQSNINTQNALNFWSVINYVILCCYSEFGLLWICAAHFLRPNEFLVLFSIKIYSVHIF